LGAKAGSEGLVVPLNLKEREKKGGGKEDNNKSHFSTKKEWHISLGVCTLTKAA